MPSQSQGWCCSFLLWSKLAELILRQKTSHHPRACKTTVCLFFPETTTTNSLPRQFKCLSKKKSITQDDDDDASSLTCPFSSVSVGELGFQHPLLMESPWLTTNPLSQWIGVFNICFLWMMGMSPKLLHVWRSQALFFFT
jgi:hypothetical protein